MNTENTSVTGQKPPEGAARFEELAQTPGLVEREALLFEAGEYPDKGLSISEDALRAMEGSFTGPAPIRVEHTDSPVRFGWLTRVWKKGRALMGTLAFTQAAWELVMESGARCLSVGLNRDTLAVEEVSLVRNPRVASARVFTNDALIAFTAQITGGFPAAGEEAELSQLRGEIALRDAREELARFVKAGKVAPGAGEAALALLAAGGMRVTFGTELTPVADLFRRFLQAQGPVVVFGELTPGAALRAPVFSMEDRRIFGMLGVSEDEVANTTKGER